MIDGIEIEIDLLRERLRANEAEAEEIREKIESMEEIQRAYWKKERKEENRSYEKSV